MLKVFRYGLAAFLALSAALLSLLYFSPATALRVTPTETGVSILAYRFVFGNAAHALAHGVNPLTMWRLLSMGPPESILADALLGQTGEGHVQIVIDILESLPSDARRRILSAKRGIIIHLVSHGRAEAALNFVRDFSPADRGSLLASSHIVSALTSGQQAQAVVDLIKEQPLEGQKQILMAPVAIDGLMSYGQDQAVINFIRAQPLDVQKDILVEAFVAGKIAYYQAEALVEFIKSQPLESQKDILSGHYSPIDALAYKGEARAVIEFINAQPLEVRGDILESSHAVDGLTSNGQAQAVVDFIRAQPIEKQRAILYSAQAVDGLIVNGQTEALLVFIKAQPHSDQKRIIQGIFSSHPAMDALTKNRQLFFLADALRALPPDYLREIQVSNGNSWALKHNEQVDICSLVSCPN